MMFKDTLSAPNPASSAVLGIFIGGTICLGPNWYYDLEELRQHSGPWAKVASGINRVKSLLL